MNQIATRGQSSPPISASTDQARLIVTLLGGMRQINFRDYEFLPDREPTSEQRRELAARRGQLETILAPASQERIASELANFFLGYPSLRGADQATAAAMLSKYTRELAGCPIWAVKRACDGFSSGRRGRASFPPTAAEMALAASEECAAPREEFWSIHKIMEAKTAAPELTDEQRQANLAKLQELKASLSTAEGVENDETGQKAFAAHLAAKDKELQLSEWRRLGVENPPAISPSLAKQLGILKESAQ